VVLVLGPWWFLVAFGNYCLVVGGLVVLGRRNTENRGWSLDLTQKIFPWSKRWVNWVQRKGPPWGFIYARTHLGGEPRNLGAAHTARRTYFTFSGREFPKGPPKFSFGALGDTSLCGNTHTGFPHTSCFIPRGNGLCFGAKPGKSPFLKGLSKKGLPGQGVGTPL